jgi:hypothetical protein
MSDGSRCHTAGGGHVALCGHGGGGRWSGDPNLGEFEDAVILKTFGDVPEDFRQV